MSRNYYKEVTINQKNIQKSKFKIQTKHQKYLLCQEECQTFNLTFKNHKKKCCQECIFCEKAKERNIFGDEIDE